jgi:signal peptidase II
VNPRDLGLACAAAALALDQCSKLILLYGFHFIEMAPGYHVAVLPFFDLVMVWNPGISYGLLPAHGAAGTAVLAAFSVAAVAGLGWWLWHAERKLLAAALGLVIGGAIGNLIDRLIYGRVADFFHFYVHGYDWYVFNVADCAITLGVAALLYDSLVRSSPGTASRQSGRSE